ncbi:hypothetical protein [Paludisphaera soli]|uniref:hypothetical protein n=1 Tax=Paludisphaera soli TaxID=2712865 RepID=UPI00197D620E|nr:hypothetical protein [Paludisphaera soli]
MSLLVASAAAPEPPGFQGDFDAAVTRIGARSKPAQYIGLDAYQAEADALAKSYGPSALQTLRQVINGPTPVSRKLALMTLVALAEHPAARAELAFRINAILCWDPLTCLAVTYAKPSAATALVEQVSAEDVRRPGGLIARSILFRFFGEAGSDERIAAALERVPRVVERDRAEIEVNLVALRQRLARPVEERPRWVAQDLMLWRALNSMPDFRGLNVSLENRATVVCAAMKFAPSFLKDRLAAASLVSYERSLLLKIVRNQRQVELVPVLAKMVDGVWPAYPDVYHALASIGTREALGSLEKFVVAPGPVAFDKADNLSASRTEAHMRGRLALHLLEILARCGDVKTLKLMEELADDGSRPTPIHAACVKARDQLRKRFPAGP